MTRARSRSALGTVPILFILAFAIATLLPGPRIPFGIAPLSGQQATDGQPSTANGEWPHYTADVRGTRYSPLDQINGSNFNKLEVAWRFKTDNLGPLPEYKLEGTPLMVKGVLYTTAGTRRSVDRARREDRRADLVAQPARRQHAPRTSPRQLSGRGVAYWTDGKGDERILYVHDRLSPRRAQREDRRADPRRSARAASSI